MGIMFNIIDTERGEKADLIPLTMASPYRFAFQRRIQQVVDLPGTQRFDVWCARPEDVIVGKLLAWAEGRSRKHETDIYEMLVYQYLESGSRESSTLDTSYVDVEAQKIGAEVAELWEAIKAAAEEEAQRIHET
jgi:hypothetical protein